MLFKENLRNNKNQFVLIFLGLLTIALGLFSTGPRLADLVSRYVSTDKVLTDQTLLVLNGVQWKIILAGLCLIALPFILRQVMKLKFVIIKSKDFFIKVVSVSGNILGAIYNIGTKEIVLWGFIVLIIGGLSIPGIFLSPAGGFHVEGVDLQPAKNLVKHGYFSTLTTEGFDTESHRSSAGPGIVMPIALLFKVFGINVYYGRALHVAFLIGTIILLFLTVRDIYNKRVAFLTVFLALAYMIMLSRSHTGMGPEGYIPSLFYMMAGAFFWFKAIPTQKNSYLVISGILWALAFQTKWLFLFIIFAVIATYFVLSLSGRSNLKSKFYLIPTAMVILVTLAWFGYRILNVGLKAELLQLQKFWAEHGHRAVGEGVTQSVFSFLNPLIIALTDTVDPINFWEDLQLFLIIPAVLYVIIQLAKSKWADYRIIFYLSFVLIWFAWWVFFNFDLPGTHLRVFLIITSMFVAKLLVDIWDWTSSHKTNLLNLVKQKEPLQNTMLYLTRIAIVIFVLGKVILPVIDKAHFLEKSYTNLTLPYDQMMDYIKNETEPNAVFAGWGWSMPWYVDIDENIDRINKDRADYPADQREKVPEYFIVSPEWPLVKLTDQWPSVSVENKWSIKANEKRIKFLDENCTLLKTFGGPKHIWLIYKVNNDTPPILSQKQLSQPE